MTSIKVCQYLNCEARTEKVIAFCDVIYLHMLELATEAFTKIWHLFMTISNIP